ncbi:transposase [Paenibacillus sp. A3]|uniref:transposase n=1 Tax=Paenibacillus sp. A3 TaxID=1337054 RepID=UPI002356F7D1|nr:transposase [Paenibacillus sp. A3]
MGRSRGGLTTKIHAMVDTLGDPLRFELTPGQDHDSVTGYRLLHELDFCPGEVLADRAYDTNAILDPLDSETYKERHLIECFFYEKTSEHVHGSFDTAFNSFMA